MRSAIFMALVIVALGAGSVFAASGSRRPVRATGKRPSAPQPISGGSMAGPNGAISGGIIKQAPKITQTRKLTPRHREMHKRTKKS